MTKRQKDQLTLYAFYAVGVAFVAAAVLLPDWPAVRKGLLNWGVAKETFPGIVTTGAKNTLILTFYGFTGGLVLGLVMALMRLSRIRAYRWFATTYIDVIRGLPALLMIILIGSGLPLALEQFRGYSRTTLASAAVAIVASAYIAEVIRAGIEAVPKGQTEAARSLGMSQGRAMVTIVIPQAFRLIIPPMTNELVLLLKDTSLVSVVGFTTDERELLRFARDGVNDNANATPLVVAGVIYLIITIPMTRLSAHLEKRAKAAR